MTKTESYQQLKEQKMLSLLRIRALEDKIRTDYSALKEDFKPWNLAGTGLRTLLKSETHGLVGESIGITIDKLVKNILFRNSNFITKGLIAFAAKNYANSLISKRAEDVLDGVQHLLRKLKSNDRQKKVHFDESTVDVGADVE